LTELLRNTVGREDPLRAALGEAKYAQYQEYQRNVRPALQQVASIGSSLNAAGQPLNDSQTRTLTAAMMTEQQRLRQEAAMPRPIPAPGVARSMADTMQETNARQEASNNRILEASSSSLNAAQLDVLKQQFEQQAAQRRSTIATARDMDAQRARAP
jgi:cysteinyl-tRNA synthetase